MEAYEYETLFEFESFYWWYKGLHSILIDAFRSAGIGPGASVLDAGCGTGQNLKNVHDQITPNAYGLDFSVHAAAFWGRRGLDRACVASINEIPYRSEAFDAVVSVDVLECEAVDERRAYAELWRVLRPGGTLILVVPAYDWLMNPEHHKAVAAVRRYTRPRVRALLSDRPVEVLRITHVFASVFPMVAMYRLADRFFNSHGDGPPRSDLNRLNPAVNSMLLGLVNAERNLLRSVDMPFGSSIMAVARKVPE